MTPYLKSAFEKSDTAEVMMILEPSSRTWNRFKTDGAGFFQAPPAYFQELGIVVGMMQKSVAQNFDNERKEGNEEIRCLGVPPPFRLIPPISSENKLLHPIDHGSNVNPAAACLGITQYWTEKPYLAPVLVGHLDTGIYGAHPSFLNRISGYAYVDAGGACTDLGAANALDACGHGSNTGGIIAGTTFDDYRPGMADNARLLSAQIIDTVDDDYVPGQRLIGGICWALAAKAKIINMSIRAPQDRLDDIEAIIASVRSQNVIPVCASGNQGSGNVEYPAAFPESLSVGASDNSGCVIDLSGSCTFLGTPNRIVPEVVGPGLQIQSCSNTGGWSSYTGTSQGAAHLSGLAAFLWGACPTATMNQVEAAIISAALPKGGDAANRVGAGIPNAKAALEKLRGGPLFSPQSNTRAQQGLAEVAARDPARPRPK
jgi:subtilisin family serine protease